MASTLEPTKRELFGGALEAEIPAVFVDASDFRPVPSSQEVFVSSSDNSDISIVVDILQRVDAGTTESSSDPSIISPDSFSPPQISPTAGPEDRKVHEDLLACKIHFEDVVDSREGSVGRLFTVQTLDVAAVGTKLGPNIPTYLLTSTVSNPSQPAPLPTSSPFFLATQQHVPYTLILMAIFRLEAHKTDLVVTVNCPITTPTLESRIWHPAYPAPPGNTEAGAASSPQVDYALAVVRQVLGSLEVKDWDLFTPED